MGIWNNGLILLDIEFNDVNNKYLLLISKDVGLTKRFSTFQYSTIPLFHVRGKISGLNKYS